MSHSSPKIHSVSYFLYFLMSFSVLQLFCYVRFSRNSGSRHACVTGAFAAEHDGDYDDDHQSQHGHKRYQSCFTLQILLPLFLFHLLRLLPERLRLKPNRHILCVFNKEKGAIIFGYITCSQYHRYLFFNDCV